jgi:hypothetical protein
MSGFSNPGDGYVVAFKFKGFNDINYVFIIENTIIPSYHSTVFMNDIEWWFVDKNKNRINYINENILKCLRFPIIYSESKAFLSLYSWVDYYFKYK